MRKEGGMMRILPRFAPQAYALLRIMAGIMFMSVGMSSRA